MLSPLAWICQQRKQRTNTKKRPEPRQKSPYQDQDCLRDDRDKPSVSPKYTHKGGEKKAATKLLKANQNAEIGIHELRNEATLFHNGFTLHVVQGNNAVVLNKYISIGSWQGHCCFWIPLDWGRSVFLSIIGWLWLLRYVPWAADNHYLCHLGGQCFSRGVG